jgi:hypothetical protein
MKISKILATTLFALLLGVGLYIFNQASNLKYQEFVLLDNIKFKNATLPPDLKITFTSDAVINNPNPYELTISKVDFDVIVDGKKTTHFTQDLEIEMGANSDFSLPLSFEVPISQKEFFKNFKNVLNGAWKKQSIKIRSLGTITIRQSRVKFEIPFDFDDEYRLQDYL